MAQSKHVYDPSRRADTTRVEAFSDAVFAIIITLLVLDLRVPQHEPGHLLGALLDQWPAYLAFAASFLYVGVIWLNHHGLFRKIAYIDRGLNWINLGVLAGAVVIPFPTAVVSDSFTSGSNVDDRRVAATLYALVAAAMSAAWIGMFAYLDRHRQLLKDDTPADWAAAQAPRAWIGVALYLLGALLAWFVSPIVGLISIIVMIIYHAITSEGIRRRNWRSADVTSNGTDR